MIEIIIFVSFYFTPLHHCTIPHHCTTSHHTTHTLIGLNGAKRIVFSSCLALGQDVEKGGFAAENDFVEEWKGWGWKVVERWKGWGWISRVRKE